MDWKKVIQRLWFIPIVAYPLIYFYIQMITLSIKWDKFSGPISLSSIVELGFPFFMFVVFPMIILYTITKQVMQEEHITIKNVWKWVIPLVLFFLLFQGVNKLIRLSDGCPGMVGCSFEILLLILGLFFIAVLMNIIYKKSKRTK